MTERVTVNLPWPHKSLSPNARVHRMALARRKKDAKDTAIQCCWRDGIKPIAASALTARVTFFPPNRHDRDVDNLISSMKAAFDGIAHRIGVDDSKWHLEITPFGEITKHGAVKVELEWQA